MRFAIRSLGLLARESLPARVFAAVGLGLFLAWALSEVSFLLLRDSSDRVPSRIELVIPAGTAERVAAGEEVPSIPPEMTFIVGDVLVVRNEDAVSHQLGPVWVPPGASASLAMQQANDYSYSCSFRPTRTLDFIVRSRVTATTRLLAVLMAGPPMGVLMAIYSLVLWPIRSPADAAGQATGLPHPSEGRAR